MGKFSPNQRNGYEGYQQNSAFDDAGKRVKRMKQRRKMTKATFARKVKEHALQEKEVMTALKNNNEVALQAIAISVALVALSVE